MSNRFEKEQNTNKALWNELAAVHYNSYPVEDFKNGKTTLDKIQLSEVGNVSGKTMLHLQCHLGLDSLAWAREGAIVTGIDFSENSIEYAEKLKKYVGIDAEFICSNVYDIRHNLNKKFDIVYTSQGVLCWLKDIREWGNVIADHLVSGGMFYIQELHPSIYMFDDEVKDELKVKYSYFNTDLPTKWDDDHPDYSDDSYVPTNPSYEWTWSLSDIINSLIDAGLVIEFVHEFPFTFYQGLPAMEKNEDGFWEIEKFRGKVPFMFTLKAVKR